MMRNSAAFRKFLDNAWESKSWILASTLALAALGYLYKVLNEFPAIYAENIRNIIMFDEKESEGKAISLVFNTIMEANKSNIESLNYYSTHVAGKPRASELEAEAIENGFVLSNTTAQKLALTQGVLEGVLLQEQHLQSNKEQFKLGFQELEDIHRSLSNFYLMSALGDSEKINESVQALQGVQEKVDRIGFRMLPATQSFSARAIALSQIEIANAQETIANLKIFHMKAWLAVVSLLYLGGYIVAVAISVWRLRYR